MSRKGTPPLCTFTYRHERACHKKGERCTHPAAQGSTYCQWHQTLPDKDMPHIKLSDADEESRHLCEAYLVNARLDEADLKGALLLDANLQGASLIQANLQGTNLSNSNLQDADLWGANLQEAMLWGANLQGAQLLLAHLEFTDLVRADLHGAMLDGAHLKFTDLRGADLQLAHFEGSHVEKLYFAGERGSARLMLCTLKNAASLNQLVAETERQGLQPDLSQRENPQLDTEINYEMRPRDAQDIARDHRVLKIYFKQEGRMDRNSHHFLEEMRWTRRHYWNQAMRPTQTNNSEEHTMNFAERIRWFFRWLKNGALDLLFGFGEDPTRLLGWSILSVFITGILLFLLDLPSGFFVALEGLPRAFAVALVSFAAAPPSYVFETIAGPGLIASAQAFLGKFFIALFVFILGRKVER